MPPRLIGLYALAAMERDGSIYGYRLSERIFERTGGSWRPGPGAVYPSLAALVERGLAVRKGAGRRQEYRITSSGRATLRRVRRRLASTRRDGMDLSELWAEVAGTDDAGPLLVRRLERTLANLRAYLDARSTEPRANTTRQAAVAALRRGSALLGRRPSPTPRGPGQRRA